MAMDDRFDRLKILFIKENERNSCVMSSGITPQPAMDFSVVAAPPSYGKGMAAQFERDKPAITVGFDSLDRAVDINFGRDDKTFRDIIEKYLRSKFDQNDRISTKITVDTLIEFCTSLVTNTELGHAEDAEDAKNTKNTNSGLALLCDAYAIWLACQDVRSQLPSSGRSLRSLQMLCLSYLVRQHQEAECQFSKVHVLVPTDPNNKSARAAYNASLSRVVQLDAVIGDAVHRCADMQGGGKTFLYDELNAIAKLCDIDSDPMAECAFPPMPTYPYFSLGYGTLSLAGLACLCLFVNIELAWLVGVVVVAALVLLIAYDGICDLFRAYDREHHPDEMVKKAMDFLHKNPYKTMADYYQEHQDEVMEQRPKPEMRGSNESDFSL